MIEFIDEYSEEYERFNASHPNGSLFQSRLWGGVKSAWRWKAVLYKEDGKIRAAAAVLIRPIPGTAWRLMYSPRGPVCVPQDKEALSILTDGLRELAKRENCYLLKLDPDISICDGVFKSNMAELGYRLQPVAKGFEYIQPQHVVRLDLRGKTEDDILSGMKGKTRYNIKLSERRGVTVRVRGKEALDDFFALMYITGTRDGFNIRPKAYFEQMLDALGEHVRLYMAYYNGIAIAGTICAQYGNKTWYLYGASSNAHRDMMPNYLLQWHMIQWALEGGCDIYDFRGIAGEDCEDSLSGLWRFKSGWGGERTTFVGEYEYIYRPCVYTAARRLLPLVQRAGLMWAQLKNEHRQA